MAIIRATPDQSRSIAVMTGQLLEEIMEGINARAFNFELGAAESRLREFIERERYFVFASVDDNDTSDLLGFVSIYESYSIYAEGAFGTIPELYVRPACRTKGIGKALLEAAKRFGTERGWSRLEVTTPPLPAFQRTFNFYEQEGFSVSGGKKLQIGL
jgi:GNAT superfamily N-acetyltransferase